ncbi:MAG: bifunctional riboflavin kinase/FAD synthetase [Gemmataceae bacterium]
MSAVSFIHWNDTPPASARQGSVAIGNFDGVHCGHRALVRQLRESARAVNGPAVCLSFDPHPLAVLRPAQFQPVLTTMQRRAELLLAAGADHVVVLRTTPELLQLTAEDFFREVIVDRLQARAVVEGPNFSFGRDRAGTIDTLRNLCGAAQIELKILEAATSPEGKPVSSSRVRAALLEGNIELASELLGRCYALAGTVVKGAARGRSLGFPTANLEELVVLVPRDGVYAVRASWGKQVWPGAANIGPNPTFQEQARKFEVHLLDFAGDLYGERLDIEFVARLRDTRKFASRDELMEQLGKDVAEARRLASQE